MNKTEDKPRDPNRALPWSSSMVDTARDRMIDSLSKAWDAMQNASPMKNINRKPRKEIEDEWEYMGKTQNGTAVYFDPASGGVRAY